MTAVLRVARGSIIVRLACLALVGVAAYAGTSFIVHAAAAPVHYTAR